MSQSTLLSHYMAYVNERAERDTWKELKVNCIRTYILLKDSFQGKSINWLRDSHIFVYNMSMQQSYGFQSFDYERIR